MPGTIEDGYIKEKCSLPSWSLWSKGGSCISQVHNINHLYYFSHAFFDSFPHKHCVYTSPRTFDVFSLVYLSLSYNFHFCHDDDDLENWDYVLSLHFCQLLTCRRLSIIMYHIYQKKDTVKLFLSVLKISNQRMVISVLESDSSYECCLINEIFVSLW